MNKPSPVIVRKIGQQPAVFLLDTRNLVQNTIDMWDGSANPPKTVPLYVYASSVPARSEEIDLWAAQYAQRFVPKGGIQIRSRIAKDLAKAYAQDEQRASQPEKAPEQPHEKTHESPLVASPENKAQQRRESSVEEMLKPRLTLEEWEKRVLVERLIDAASKAFASSLSAIMKESLKA